MIAHNCTHQNRSKHGKDRNGNQRWRCRDCGATFASEAGRPLGNMRIDLDEAIKVLGMLLEGMSIRACSRLIEMKHGTICDLVLTVGENCDRFLGAAVRNVTADAIELDEIWGFVDCKDITKKRLGRVDECGDSWTWLAIDADSKLVLSHAVGQRDEATCEQFLSRLNGATSGPMQVTSDGLRLYTYRVPMMLGSRITYAQLIKNYKSTQTETRYSPATITGIDKAVRFVEPDEGRISTSYAERLNLSVRMHCRRFTRLTNAHSKTSRHHAAMVALFVAWYNFCRANEALGKGKVSPAMAAGLTKNRWTIKELLLAAA
jgi:transposase-like protein/IS1 family transposase